MATIEVNPLILKDVDLTIATHNFKKHVSGVTFQPAASQLTWTGLGGNAHTDQAAATWTCTINYVQDWETTNSLSQYLFAHENEVVAASFKPRSGSGPSFTVQLSITPGAIGGEVNAYAATSVTLGCQSKPTLVAATQGG